MVFVEQQIGRIAEFRGRLVRPQHRSLEIDRKGRRCRPGFAWLLF